MIAFYISISLGEVSRMKPIAFSVAPASAVLLGALFLGESLTPRKLFAVALILVGVVLLGLKPTTKPSAQIYENTHQSTPPTP